MENTEYKFEEKLIVSELIKDASPAIREALRMQIRMISRKMIEPKLSVADIEQMDVGKFYKMQAKFGEKYNIKSEWDFLEKR